MSRFFATNSDSESESSSSEEEIQQKPAVKAFYAASDEDEETKRVVRSSKDKRFEEIQNIIKTMKNHKKIKDMSNVLSDFEDLCRAYEKAKKITEKEGTPRFYVRCLVELDDFVNQHWDDTEFRKSMSKNNSKGFAALRQKMKKYNRNFEDDIANYRKNPDMGDEDERDDEIDDEDESEEEEEEDANVRFIPDLKKPGVAAAKEEESESDSEWGSSGSSESESSDDEIRPMSTLTADYFRKKDKPEGEAEPKKKKVPTATLR